ncbi:MAG: WG repeat-containing protein [Chitinophagales bacterium]
MNKTNIQMIRNLLTLCLTIFGMVSLSAQDTLITKSYYKDGYFKLEQNGLYGLSTLEDSIILPIAYKSLWLMEDDLLKAQNSGDRYGLITMSNDTVLPFEYDKINEFNNGLSVVYKDYKFGMINTAGEIILPLEYSYLSKYSEGLIAFRKEGNCGVMDIEQNIIIPTDKFKFINEFYDGYAVVTELPGEVYSANKGIINKKGEWIAEPNYSEIYRNFNGYKTTKTVFIGGKYSTKKSVTKYGFIDVKNNFVLEPAYDELVALNNGNFFTREDTTYYIINRSFDTLMTYNEGKIYTLSNAHLKVYNNKLQKYALVNSEGKFLSDFVYGTISNRYDDFLYVSGLDNLIILSANGDTIKLIDNAKVLGSSEKQAIISNDFKIMVYDFDQQDFIFEKSIPKVKSATFNGNEIYIEQKNNYAFFNLKTKETSVLPYDVLVQANEDGIMVVENGMKKGVITVDNKVIFEPVFSKILSSDDGVIITQDGYYDSLVAYNYNAEKLFSLPHKDVEYSKFSDGLMLSRMGAKYYFIDKSGKQVFESLMACGDFYNDRAVFQGSYGLIGFYDKTGQKVIPASYKAYGNFSDNGLAPVQFGPSNLWGFINKEGETVIDFQFDEVGAFNNGYAMVKKGGKLGFINETGKVIVPLEYDELKSFSDGLFGVKKDNLWGFIDTKGKVKVPLQFDEVAVFSDGCLLVRKI